ncbi:MAG: biotin--[acetyl-CoA-carboxylase] ligase, partial [Armatimonadota bacterium]|nr:biotin--[acetyl-CoA-carboxylase] ligase [Armatimonadota bacterium]
AGEGEGAVIVARQQNAGRGRDGRSWESLPGALLFSVLLRPSWPASHLPRLGFLACVAGALTAEETGAPRAPLKWPNDLVFPITATSSAPHNTPGAPGGILSWAKWGGILVETGAAGQAALWAVVGVGLNVGSLDVVPEDLRPPNATSLSDTLGRAVDPDLFLNRYLEHFKGLYDDSENGWDRALQGWRERDILLGQRVRATSNGNPVEGAARGINERGALLLETVAGVIPIEVGDVHLEKAVMG